MTTSNVAERLNQSCFCIGADVSAARARLGTLLAASGAAIELEAAHAHLFSELPVFVSHEHLAAMQAIVRAIRSVVDTPEWKQQALLDVPETARFDPGIESAFTAYDFHVDATGPKLIEINTNAGGALLCAEATRSLQRSEHAPVDCLQSPVVMADIDDTFVEMFVEPYKAKFRDRPLRRIAIVDDSPTNQYLYPEFLLFRDLFLRAGIATVIADAASLIWQDGQLTVDGQPIDIVYNRLTDFYLESPDHAALKSALLSGQVLVTPHPNGHALFANKRNLARLTDEEWLTTQGVSAATRRILLGGIPQTHLVNTRPGEWWWEHRADWFFKPACGFGSKGTYRGSKVTRRVFSEIMSGDYIAQHFVAPSLRRASTSGTSETTDLKVDLRCFAHEDRIVLVAARLYQGQTTNFRTSGGGFALVFVPEGVEKHSNE